MRLQKLTSSLEDTIARQDELIAEQMTSKKASMMDGQEEIGQLTEILEAQERSLTDQRAIIEEQARLIADLSRHMQDGDEDGDEDRPQFEGRQAASSSRGPSAEPTPWGPPAPRMSKSDPNQMPTSRLSPREMLLKRGPSGGPTAPHPSGAPGNGPPRPRPNSAGRSRPDGQRAKSMGVLGRDRNGQESEIVRRPLPKQPTTCTAQAGGRPNGRRYPPALPVLEQKI